MLNQPILKPRFHVEIQDPETVYLLSEKNSFALSGQLYCQLIPLLDGHHSIDDLVAQLKEQFSLTAIYVALILLQEKGYIIEANPDLSAEFITLADAVGVDPLLALNRLMTTKLGVLAFGSLTRAPLVTCLQSEKITISDPAVADVLVAITDDYLQVGLARLNQMDPHLS
jgi:ribosomal protein S12 methylthiotransferase accessory factor